MANPKPDWTQFTQRIIIDRPLQEVYQAWALPKNLSQWFLEKADFTGKQGKYQAPEKPIKKGQTYQWKWHNWEEVQEGKVLEANGKNQIDFSFGDGGNVHIWLKSLNKGTELKLVQDGIPADEKSKMNFYVGCATGWTFWLTNLKAWLEHGITLNATGLSQEEVQHLVNS